MRKIGAFIVGALLCAACGGGDEAQKPAVAPPPPEPVASAAPTPAPSQAATPAPAKPSMADLMAAAMKNVADTQSAHDAKKFAALYTEDATVMIPGMGEQHGRADIEKNEQMFYDGFKDMKFWVSRAWVKGDMAACEWGWSGTNNGDFMGMKATEKPAGGMGLSLVWLTPEGLIKKENRYFDMGTTMTQLGHGKGKARPVPTAAASVEMHSAKGTPDEDKVTDIAKGMAAAFESKKDTDFTANLADDCTYDDISAPEVMKGKDSAKKWFGMFTKAFPDAKGTADTTFGVEDFLISEHTTTGTHKGQFGPFAATKKPVTLHGVDVMQVKGGKVVKAWGFDNSAELMMQIGVMKAPSAAPAPAAKTDAKADAKGGDKGAAAKPAGDKGAAAKPATPATPAKK